MERRNLSYYVMEIQELGKHISGMNHRCPLSEWSSKKQRSSLVIDSLCDGVKGDNAAVAYVYCDYTIQKEQSARSVLGAVLRQVIRVLSRVPDEVREAFEHAKRQVDGCGPLLDEIQEMLVVSLPHLEKGFICIDALDEFQKFRPEQWDGLWGSLQHVVRECPNTRLFLTGRPQIRADVEKYFPKEANMVMVEATSDDVGRYIEKRLKEDLHSDAMDKELRADILRVVPDKVSGMCVYS